MKLKKFNQFTSEINERNAQYRTGSHTYDMVTLMGDLGYITIKVNGEGLIADNGKHLSWENIDELKKQFVIDPKDMTIEELEENGREINDYETQGYGDEKGFVTLYNYKGYEWRIVEWEHTGKEILHDLTKKI